MSVHRQLLAIALGIGTFLATWWLSHMGVFWLGTHIGSSYSDLAGYAPAWLDAAYRILPGLVVGIVASSMPVRLATIAAFTASSIAYVFQLAAGVPSSSAGLVTTIVLAIAFSAVASAGGAYIRQAWSNYAFKRTAGTGHGVS